MLFFYSLLIIFFVIILVASTIEIIRSIRIRVGERSTTKGQISEEVNSIKVEVERLNKLLKEMAELIDNDFTEGGRPAIIDFKTKPEKASGYEIKAEEIITGHFITELNLSGHESLYSILRRGRTQEEHENPSPADPLSIDFLNEPKFASEKTTKALSPYLVKNKSRPVLPS